MGTGWKKSAPGDASDIAAIEASLTPISDASSRLDAIEAVLEDLARIRAFVHEIDHTDFGVATFVQIPIYTLLGTTKVVLWHLRLEVLETFSGGGATKLSIDFSDDTHYIEAALGVGSYSSSLIGEASISGSASAFAPAPPFQLNGTNLPSISSNGTSNPTAGKAKLTWIWYEV